MIKFTSIRPFSPQGTKILRSKRLSQKLNQPSNPWLKLTQPEGYRVGKCLAVLGDLSQETIQLLIATSKWMALNLLLAILDLPHQIWRVFMPNQEGSQPVSCLFRRAFEAKSVKRILGVNLAVAVLTTTLIQSSLPTLATETTALEVLPQPQEVLTTETTFRQPVGGYISQGFHWYHPGVDIAGNDNQIIYPIARGTVQLVEYDRFGYGNSVIVTHENSLASRYAHLVVVKVKPGENIDKNTAIGYIGSTGWSTGPHLHLEIYDHGTPVNPLTVLPSYSEE